MVPSELADGENDQRRGEYHEERRQKVVAARVLLREALERGAELAEPVLGERAVREPRQLRQGGGPEGRFLPQLPRLAHRSEQHTSELQSQSNLVCRLLLEKKNRQ